MTALRAAGHPPSPHHPARPHRPPGRRGGARRRASRAALVLACPSLPAAFAGPVRRARARQRRGARADAAGPSPRRGPVVRHGRNVAVPARAGAPRRRAGGGRRRRRLAEPTARASTGGRRHWRGPSAGWRRPRPSGSVACPPGWTSTVPRGGRSSPPTRSAPRGPPAGGLPGAIVHHPGVDPERFAALPGPPLAVAAALLRARRPPQGHRDRGARAAPPARRRHPGHRRRWGHGARRGAARPGRRARPGRPRPIHRLETAPRCRRRSEPAMRWCSR